VDITTTRAKRSGMWPKARRGVSNSYAKLLAGCRTNLFSTNRLHLSRNLIPSGQTCIHPQVKTKCGALFTAGALAESVEKSFKVVRDRLRELTGYEKGSDAFGKGKRGDNRRHHQSPNPQDTCPLRPRRHRNQGHWPIDGRGCGAMARGVAKVMLLCATRAGWDGTRQYARCHAWRIRVSSWLPVCSSIPRI